MIEIVDYKLETKLLLDQSFIGPQLYWDKYILDQISFGPVIYWSKPLLDQSSLDKLDFGPIVLDQKNWTKYNWTKSGVTKASMPTIIQGPFIMT